MQITIIITTPRKEEGLQPEPRLLPGTARVLRATRKMSVSSGLRFITCVVLFVLGNLGLGRRQGGLGWLWLWGRELQHPGARLMGTEGGIGVLGRAVQDEAPLFQLPWKAPDPESPEGQEPPSGST